MSNVQQIIKRNAYAFVAGVFTLAAVLPSVLMVTPVFAEEQITERQIMMSSSVPSAPAVSYEVSFKVATTGTVQGIIVDYCSNSPIVDNSTCSAPGGLDVGTTGLTVGGALDDTWTAASPSNNRLVLTKTGGDSLNADDQVTFTTGGYVNQSATGTFYARILTFADTSHTAGYVSGDMVDVVDAGGVALSTAKKIGVTATVQETLMFCVRGDNPTTQCGAASTPEDPEIELGSGSPLALSTGSTDTASVYYQVSTNAALGVVVRMKGSTLQSGTNDINPIGAVAAALTGEGFGFRTTGATSPGTTEGTVTDTSPYAIGTTGTWAFDATNLGDTYGQQIASSAGPVYDVNKEIEFAARAGGSTPAGVYTTDLSLVAVGKY